MMPELIHIGPFTVYTYGFMWMVGIGLALWRAARVAPRYGVRPDDLFDLTFVMVLLGILGGRVAFVITQWSLYADDPLKAFRIWEGGMSYFGGFGLAILAGLWMVRRRRLPAWQIADLAAPSVALGYAIARVGCFGAGCCYGAPTDLPWGVLFPGHSEPCHPTQLYSTAMNLIIFAVLLGLEKRPRHQGQLFGWFLALHGGYRFINEFFRAGATSVIAFAGLTYGHLVALLVVGAGLFIAWRCGRYCPASLSTHSLPSTER